MKLRVQLAGAAALLFTVACSSEPHESSDADTTWVGTITTEGSVTTVVNESGSVWRVPVESIEGRSTEMGSSEEPYVAGQEASPSLLAAYGASGGEPYFDDIRAASIDAGVIVVLTPPDPAVHVIERDRITSWGKEGQGPGEFMEPVDVVLRRGRVSVLDQTNRRISSFEIDGRLLETQSIASFWANRLATCPGKTHGLDDDFGDARRIARARVWAARLG